MTTPREELVQRDQAIAAGRGNWLPWLEREFGQVQALGENRDMRDLNIGVSVPSTSSPLHRRLTRFARRWSSGRNAAKRYDRGGGGEGVVADQLSGADNHGARVPRHEVLVFILKLFTLTPNLMAEVARGSRLGLAVSIEDALHTIASRESR